MKLIKESSFNEYVRWYLDREFRKNNQTEDNPSRFKDEDELSEFMEKNHSGKLRPYIVVTMPTNGFNIYFSVKNHGKRAAYNVDISVNPDLDLLQLLLTIMNYFT